VIYKNKQLTKTKLTTKMKLKLFFITLLFFPLPLINAQCKDCFPKENDWKFAAGITLYSNNLYVSQYKLLERQPLEFNFRYKFGQNHMVKLSTPIAWKVKLTRDPNYTEPNYPLDESLDNKALAYYIAMKNDVAYSNFSKTKESYYNLFGGSVGYDYNMNLVYGISVAGGVDFSYYYCMSFEKFYGILYSKFDDNNNAHLDLVDYTERTNSWNAFAAKPQVSLRYQFQKLLLEGSVGYAFTISNGFAKMKSQLAGSNEDYYGASNRNYDFNKIVFQLSLLYTL
jgi:hypothetical protein